MVVMMTATLNPILESKTASTAEALALFDTLDPVDLAFMMGRWQGAEIQTNHPLNGFLVAARWYGKEFLEADCVHPLLFQDGNAQIFKVCPNLTVMQWSLQWPWLKSQPLQPMLRLLTGLMKTGASQARLRMTEYRQKLSATMIYDRLPINDIFRKVDDNTVLGLMDFKGVPQPFFFLLKRDTTSQP